MPRELDANDGMKDWPIEVVVDDTPESLHQLLDEAGIPRYLALGAGSGQLTLLGRTQLMTEQLTNTTKLANATSSALESIRANPAERMLLARQLLARSFKWLQGFEATADLRQEIKLFLDQK